jgi:hypothetical protein
LLAYRELDDVLGLTAMAGESLSDARIGKNGRHVRIGMLRQSVFGRLAGYEDVNDARLPANRILQDRIAHLLTRPIGRPPNEVRRSYANFTYQAGSWTKPRRVIAKVEWHPGELYPRVGFLVTNMVRPAENVVVFYNKRGTCEQWIKEGKGAIKWTRPDAAQAGKRRQKPSAPSMRPPVQPEAGTICANSAFI